MSRAGAAALPAPPLLHDGVVAVRLLAPGDAAAIAAAVPAGEPGGWEATPGPYSLAKAKAIVAGWEAGRRRGERLALAVLAEAGEFLGSVVFQSGTPASKERADAGQLEGAYWIRPDRRGNGYAARALRLATAWALSLSDVSRVWLEVDRDNLASRRVATSCGFVLSGLRWEALHPDAAAGDVLIFERR
jgi:RimJ/RimL family protein N-acetyltransferase